MPLLPTEVVSIEKDTNSTSYITKGDSNELEDSVLVDFNMIERIYKYKISDIGKVLMFIILKINNFRIYKSNVIDIANKMS